MIVFVHALALSFFLLLENIMYPSKKGEGIPLAILDLVRVPSLLLEKPAFPRKDFLNLKDSREESKKVRVYYLFMYYYL